MSITESMNPNNWKIHMTHSRKELLDCIRIFKLPVTNRSDKNKSQLSSAIIECINFLTVIEPESEFFFVACKEELIEYLVKENQYKSLTIKEKDEVMLLAKKIIQYARNQYLLIPSSYMDTKEIYNDAKYISKYTEIPSVRKAIELYNLDPKAREKVELIIPRRIKIQLEKRKKVKMSTIPLYVKQGEFILDFD